MLNELTIENIAVIEKAQVRFESGLNVLTGETGAGKSILIDSINAILGNRTSRDLVRNGALKGKVWAHFDDLSLRSVPLLEQAGYEPEGELLLYREIGVDGKTSCRINGRPATAGLLREIGAQLITIHGQHDNQSLIESGQTSRNSGQLCAVGGKARGIPQVLSQSRRSGKTDPRALD